MNRKHCCRPKNSQIAGLVLFLVFTVSSAAFSISPFEADTPLSLEKSVEENAKASSRSEISISLRDVIDKKNAIPNFPWNWKARDNILLDAAPLIASTKDIIALTKESGSEKVREKIILLGASTPKNLTEIKDLCNSATATETRDKILVTNASKLSLDEALKAAKMASPEARQAIMQPALSKVYNSNKAAGNTLKLSAWVTDPDGKSYLQKRSPNLCFGDYAANYQDINVDESSTYQEMDGFGFAITGGSAYLLSKLSATERKNLLKKFFLPAPAGIGVSVVRLSIGASDLSRKSFSYDGQFFSKADPGLSKFDIFAGDKEVIPVLKEILALSPNIRILATPWSAPPWMKTNNRFKGGSLKPEYYECYARYFVKYLKAMKSHGIKIQAISPQNEPENGHNVPSMVMDAKSQAEFIGKHLGPQLEKAGFKDVEIFCWDHNCDHKEYPTTVLNSDAAKYVTGAAWHLYAGNVSAISEVKNSFPDKKMYLSEQWTGKDGKFAGDFRWHIKTVLIGSTRNWCQAVFEWNLASDPKCDPHTLGGCPDCRGAVTISPYSVLDKVLKKNKPMVATPFNVSYYVVGHAAGFVTPGSVRIDSKSAKQFPNVAFQTTDGRIVLIALNDSQEPKLFNIDWHGKKAVTWLNPGAAGTYVWKAD